MIERTIFTILLCMACAVPARAQTRAAVQTPPEKGAFLHYTGNRPPLVPNPLVKLPVGSIRPMGWLRYQVQALADGLTGHMDELSRFCRIEGNAWVNPAGMGHSPWEEFPYWLRSLTHVAYVLDDPHLKAKALAWLNPILRHQRQNGYFGTEENLKDMDLWPNMLVLDAAKTYYEATNDPRIPVFLGNYFRFESNLQPNTFLYRSWQKVRGGDNLDSIYWLYNRTGDEGLLQLAKLNHQNTASWFENIPSPHGVNIAQGFKEPAIYYQQDADPKLMKSVYLLYDSVMNYFGRVPGGMFGADEICRNGFNGPRQCAETCTMMEFMASHLFLASLTADIRWADRCEDVAFNSLPAAFSPDLKALHYLTAPNQPVLDRRNKSPFINNEGEMFTYRPDYYRCCIHNTGQGWPVFAEDLFFATRDGGLAAVLYAPCLVKARVGKGGGEVTIQERTQYPFRESIAIEVKSGGRVRFPLYLRIPEWCDKPVLSVNGVPLGVKASPLDWVVVEREFSPGDVVRLNLPMKVKPVAFDPNRAGWSVVRGPLAYSLKIGETWKLRGGKKEWPRWEVFPSTPWNYALVEGDMRAIEQPVKANAQVFTPDNAPVIVLARARRVPAWKLERNGLVQEIGNMPVISTEPAESVTLVPLGCARLRISVFPRLQQ